MKKKEEGVVKFRAICRNTACKISEEKISELEKWRKKLFNLGLIGKYETSGIAYGNASKRMPPYNDNKGKRKFIITASQTSGIEHLNRKQYSTIISYNSEENSVFYNGLMKPSSEAMTHGSIYDQSSEIRCVFHVHSPLIWKNRKKLGLPQTAENVAYGTPDMAHEVTRLFKKTDVAKKGIFATGGHEEGVFSFGKTIEEAGRILLRYFERAK